MGFATEETTIHLELDEQATLQGTENDFEAAFLEEHWECFDSSPSPATGGPLKADPNKSKRNLPPLQTGEVYGLLDFCCHRVPAWYDAEVNKFLQVVETKNGDGKLPETGESSYPRAWKVSHDHYLVQQSMLPGRSPADIAATGPAFSSKPARAPTKIQPGRGAKRKIADLEDSPYADTKRRKVAAVTQKAKGARTDSPTGGGYHITEQTYYEALHLSSRGHDLYGKPCQRHRRLCRNRLIARVVSRMMGIYSRKAAAGTKRCQCALHGHHTASPWCHTDKAKSTVVVTAATVERSATPEAEMLPSPSFANWPPMPKKRGGRVAKEKVEENVVEFEGLKFLLDVCGEPPVPRVLMLEVEHKEKMNMLKETVSRTELPQC